MKNISLGWQSWSPLIRKWHGFPLWDYNPLPEKVRKYQVNKKSRAAAIKYWCSWYAHGWNITDTIIDATLHLIKQQELRFTHILIDDGWTTWGDWHSPELARFPNLAGTVKKIRSHKLQAGIWFAPFLASNKSRLFQEHPGWFIKHNGSLIQGMKTAPIWEPFLPKRYLLNFQLPPVRKYITTFIDRAVKEWGITLIKLDFLYAPYFNPHHSADDIPHNQVKWLLRYIKTNYPKIYVIACGAPFAPSLGIADSIRISKDTALPPPAPTLLNRFLYRSRVKMLAQKLKVLNHSPHFVADPDVRMFSLDTAFTRTIWDDIPANVFGVGDNLTTLSPGKLNQLKLWLNKAPGIT